MLGAFTLDQLGLRFPPWPMLAVALSGGVAGWYSLGPGQPGARSLTAAFCGTVLGIAAWLLFLASPAFLPLGSGPDLTHHLQLIDYIERHWTLVHDRRLEPFLGEMVWYTPGSHLLTALGGAWSGTSGVQAFHAVVSASTALKAGFVILIAWRSLARTPARLPCAVAGALSLLASPTFFLGSTLEYAFLAQVVSELFAVAMWWALATWYDTRRSSLLVWSGVFGAALFLTWPVLIGPPLLLLGALVVWPHPQPLTSRLPPACVAVAIVVMFAGLFSADRVGWFAFAGVGGAATRPTLAAYGWPFAIGSTLGLVAGAWHRPARVSTIFAAAIALQAAVLVWFAARGGNNPYMALKLSYMFLFVQAVGVAIALGVALRWVQAWTPPPVAAWVRGRERALAWVAVLAIGFTVVPRLARAPESWPLRVQPAVTAPLLEAGRYARAHLPPECVEYIVADGETAYWLHLAMLGNRRMSARTGDDRTYARDWAIYRWLQPEGLPFAIADLRVLPADIRASAEVVAAFDTAAVLRRRGSSSCESWP